MYTLTKRITKLASKYGCQISFPTNVSEKRQHSLWYGGDVCIIERNNYKYHLSALGDVIATLYKIDSKSGMESTLFYVKDKYNMADFGMELKNYIDSDEKLQEMLEGKIVSSSNDNNSLILEMDDNNWWEVSVTSPDGVWHDLMCCLDSDKFEDALLEVLESLDELIEDL